MKLPNTKQGSSHTGPIAGLDVGGANLKLACTGGYCDARSFPMWTDFQRLGSVVAEMLKQAQAENNLKISGLAVTLTGELADCFASRHEGVAYILQQLAACHDPQQTWVYATDGRFLSPQQACDDPWAVAASNWHALASWATSVVDIQNQEINVVVDIGSTTTDIIPVAAGRVVTDARTDRDRLQSGQLVYSGVRRTPVASIVSAVQIEGQRCPLMAERFATADDAYLLLALQAEAPADCDTADGRPRTLPCAQARLARMVGEDVGRLSFDTIRAMAQQIVDRQAQQVAEALRQVLRAYPCSAPVKVLLSGQGPALFERVHGFIEEELQVVSLAEQLSPSASRVAPALAVAQLLERAPRSVSVEGNLRC